ncbi:hypothetical protein D3C86_1894560 [compost metagenome]
MLGDLQRVEKVSDRHAGLAVDEVQDAVMRAAKTAFFQDGVRIGGEVAIGEEKQLDDFEVDRIIVVRDRVAHISGVFFGLAGHAVISFQPSCNLRNNRKNMSALLTYFYCVGSVHAR